MEWSTIFLIFIVGILLIIVFLAIVGIIAFLFGRKEMQKRIYKFLKPNLNDIEQDISRLNLKYPNFSPNEIAHAHVKEQAKFLALTAFITEIPIFGTVVDISFTTLKQMRMLHVITALYGNDRLDPEELETKYMAMVGGTSFLGRALIKGITGEIPILNGFINCGLNWSITRGIGEVGIGWNEEKGVWITTKQTLENARQKMLTVKDETLNKINSTTDTPETNIQ
jgi:hypothetical protein